MLVLDCDFLRPKQGWQCGRQMVPLVFFLIPMNKQTGPSQSGLVGRQGMWKTLERVGDRE